MSNLIARFYFAEPLYVDVPVTQYLPYYPYLDNNPLAGLKGAGLAQPPLQLANNGAQQISIPIYTPVYNQKQLIPPVKAPYSTVGPVTFTTKVSLICTNTAFLNKLYFCSNDYAAIISPRVVIKRETVNFLSA